MSTQNIHFIKNTNYIQNLVISAKSVMQGLKANITLFICLTPSYTDFENDSKAFLVANIERYENIISLSK